MRDKLTRDEVLDMVNVLEEKKSYILDHLPANDYTNGQIKALIQVIEYIRKELDRD